MLEVEQQQMISSLSSSLLISSDRGEGGGLLVGGLLKVMLRTDNGGSRCGLRGWDIVYHIVPLGAARLWRQPIITGDSVSMENDKFGRKMWRPPFGAKKLKFA